MSVSGRSVFLDTALALDEETADQFVRLPRNTLSAAPAHRASRGLQAILVSFDRKVQHAIRRLAFERMILDARLKAETERMQLTEQNLYREPDVVTKTRIALKDNDYNIRRLAGDATPQILAALEDPAIQEALQLAVPTEDDTLTEKEARVWRRKLISLPIPVRVDAPYRYASHDSPTVRGNKDLHNVLSSRTGEENLSYYQRSQLRYGKGRRGSTSIAGAWEEVWNNPQGNNNNSYIDDSQHNQTNNLSPTSYQQQSPRLNTSNNNTYSYMNSPNNNNTTTTTSNNNNNIEMSDLIAQLEAKVSQLKAQQNQRPLETSQNVSSTTTLPQPLPSNVMSPRTTYTPITPAPTPLAPTSTNNTTAPTSTATKNELSDLLSRAKLLLAESSLP